MPTEHIRFSYTFEELSADAQKRAVEIIAEKLGGDWWDSADNERVAETITYRFARALGTPGHDQFGEADFPGIDSVKLEGWCLAYVQGDYVGFSGTLTRENAPSLPWVDGIEHMTLEAKRLHTSVWFAMADDDSDSTSDSACKAMKEAIQEAIRAAQEAGYAESDYIGSEENAREWIADSEREFNLDGTLFI